MTVVFWAAALLALYTWGIFPGILLIADKWRKSGRPAAHALGDAGDDLPPATVVITAYNEERVIAQRIGNLLQQGYPREKLEIIVASDGSSDRTASIAQQYEPDGVKVMHWRQNRGRALVQRDAIGAARADIVVLTDAETVFEQGVLKHLLGHFRDPGVGCAIGKLVYRQDRGTAVESSEGIYFRYENRIRAWESSLGTVVSGTGAALAFRRALYEAVSAREESDDSIPLVCLLKGFRTVFEPRAIAYDTPPASAWQELRSRDRNTSRALASTFRLGVQHFSELTRRPWLMFTVVSHRIFRWLTPFFLLSVLVANIFLLGTGRIYVIALIGQAFLYLLGIAGGVLDLLDRRFAPLSGVYTFLLANVAMLMGVVRFARGRTPASWKR